MDNVLAFVREKKKNRRSLKIKSIIRAAQYLEHLPRQKQLQQQLEGKYFDSCVLEGNLLARTSLSLSLSHTHTHMLTCSLTEIYG